MELNQYETYKQSTSSLEQIKKVRASKVASIGNIIFVIISLSFMVSFYSKENGFEQVSMSFFISTIIFSVSLANYLKDKDYSSKINKIILQQTPPTDKKNT